MATLFVVGTPIGNLSDISPRALETLRSVDYIYCENPRVTKKLLMKYDIETPVKQFGTHSGEHAIQAAEDLLHKGCDIALVSDAGTPTISDPGARFVKHIHTLPDVTVITIPGPSALTAALSVSGAPASRFIFYGFLPTKRGRKTLFQEIAHQDKTVVLYESPHRLLKTLSTLNELLGDHREMVIAKELTKIYETVITGTIADVQTHFEEHKSTIKGEFVLIIPAQRSEADNEE